MTAGHWRRRIRDEGAAALRTPTMAIVSTLATLCRPTSEAQANALAVRLDELAREDVNVYLWWYQRLYPGRRAISPLGPGPYGNIVIAKTLAAEPWIPPTLAAVGTHTQIGNALTVLGRAVPEQPSLRTAIVNLITADPDRLVRLATNVADRLENHEPFVRAVVSVIESVRLEQETVMWLMDKAAMTPRRHLDPIRAALVPIFPGGFKDLIETLRPAETPPPFAPLQKVMDGIENMMYQLGQSFLDPAAKAPPTGPDGKPIISQDLLRMARMLMDWQRRDNDPQR
jgi:hypothetical protein